MQNYVQLVLLLKKKLFCYTLLLSKKSMSLFFIFKETFDVNYVKLYTWISR